MKRSELKVGAKSEKRGSTFKAERRPLERTELARVSQRRLEAEEAAVAAGKAKPRRGNSTMRQGSGGSFKAASPEQREAVKGRACAVCGNERGVEGVDPAHLTSRANPHGEPGCDDPRCVIPLCRLCHDDFDGRTSNPKPDLAEVLALDDYREQRAHMAEHMTFPMALQRLTGQRWRPAEAAIPYPMEAV